MRVGGVTASIVRTEAKTSARPLLGRAAESPDPHNPPSRAVVRDQDSGPFGAEAPGLSLASERA